MRKLLGSVRGFERTRKNETGSAGDCYWMKSLASIRKYAKTISRSTSRYAGAGRATSTTTAIAPIAIGTGWMTSRDKKSWPGKENGPWSPRDSWEAFRQTVDGFPNEIENSGCIKGTLRMLIIVNRSHQTLCSWGLCDIIYNIMHARQQPWNR